MSVYVDDMRAPFGRMKMSHMVADSQEELLAMAKKIGVAEKWIQYAGSYREHFDVAESKRLAAIQNGATAVSRMDVGRIIEKKRRTSTGKAHEAVMELETR